MKMKRFRARMRVRPGLPALAAAVFACIIAVPWSDTRAGTTPTYSINFHAISAGGNLLHSSCFRLWGTIGQAAPGYSSGATNSVFAGFWAVATTTGADEIFFDGFEGC